MSAVSGHVFRYEGKRRPVWRAKYRLPDGRQVQKTIGPAWTARGRPPAGYFTKRTSVALRFHDLRHTFGTRVIGVADIPRVQEWMGDANVQTTMQYLHYVPRPQDAALVGKAFESSPSPPAPDFEDSGQGRLL
jgi:integrase